MQNSLSNIMQSKICTYVRHRAIVYKKSLVCTVISVWFPAFKHLCHIYPDDKWDDARCKAARMEEAYNPIYKYINTYTRRIGEPEKLLFYTFEKFPENEPIMLKRKSVDGIKAICGVCVCVCAHYRPNVPAHLTSFHIQVI